MRRYLIKVFLFVALFFLIDKLAFFILDAAPKYAFDRRLEMVLEGKVNKDIIIAGSSRGAKGISAQMIQDSTQYSAYSLCYNGTDIPFHEFIIRTLLKYNRTPKAILLTVDDPTELWDVGNYGFRADLMTPLAVYDDVNEELIRNKVNFVAGRYFLIPRLREQHLFPGYEKIPKFDTVRSAGAQWLTYYSENRDFERYSAEYYDIQKEVNWKKESFENVRVMCEENGVQLILVYPPNFKEFNHDFEARMRELMGPEVLHCIYNHEDSVYLDKDLYYDPDHLHVKGAKVFTEEVIEFLKGLEL